MTHASKFEHFRNALQKQVDLFKIKESETIFETLSKSLCDCDTHISGIKQVVFCAVGKSAGVAQLAVSMFHSVGIRARFLHPTEALHGDLGLVQKSDIVICISNGGKSSEILQIIPFLENRTQEIYCITSQPKSPLALRSKLVCLLPQVEENCPLGQAPLTSTVTTLCYCQALVAATLELRQIELSRYAENHPGGAIGKRIFVKVANIMLPRGSLEVCKSSDSFSSCVSGLTKSGSSGICVVSGENILEGLISEKDIRVAMEKHGKQVFDLCAEEIMNKKPLTLSSDLLATEALQIMEGGNRIFNVVPVIEASSRKLEGLVRLIDLHKEGITL